MGRIRPRWTVNGKVMILKAARVEAAYKVFDFDVEELKQGVWIGVEGSNNFKGHMKLGIHSFEVCDKTKDYTSDEAVQELIYAITDKIMVKNFEPLTVNAK